MGSSQTFPEPSAVGGAEGRAGPPVVTSIFISHVEEDRGTAEEIVRGLQEHGYRAWIYESDTLPGPTYLAQVVDAIEHAGALVLILSPQAMGSHQVAREIEVAHEMDRPIIPVLKGVTHEKWQQRRPDWRLALGGHTSIAIPSGGIPEILPRIVGGLRALGVGTGGGPPPPPAIAPEGRRLGRLKLRPRTMVIGGVLLAIAAVAVAWLLFFRGDEQEAATGRGAAPRAEEPAGAGPEAPAGPAVTGDLEGILEVQPTEVASGGPISVTYEVTNVSDDPVESSVTEIVLLIGRDLYSQNLVLADLSQDIGPGESISGEVTADLIGVSPGDQKVFISAGRRIEGGTTDTWIVVEAPVTVA